MLTLLYLRGDPRAGLDLDLIVAGVFPNEPIQVFWFDPDGITNLNGRKLSLLDKFVDKSLKATIKLLEKQIESIDEEIKVLVFTKKIGHIG